MFFRLTLILVFLSSLSLSASWAEDAEFQQALTAFQNKKYAEAEKLFEKAALEHPQEASILHNWALTEVQLGHKGLAVALWRKALSIAPDFGAARQGRDYLESRYQMRGYEKDPWMRSVNRQIDSFPFDDLLAILALALALGGWLWIRYIKARRSAFDEVRASPAFPSVATFITLVFLGVLTILLWKTSLQLAPRATTVAENVPARSLPSEQGAPLYELKEGSEVLVKRHQQDWLQVTNSDGLTGWVKNNQVMITQGW
jgi:tetratricopeptide (TPR) repeat protein